MRGFEIKGKWAENPRVLSDQEYYKGGYGMNYPKMYRVRQIFDVPKVDNIEETVSQELESIQNSSPIKVGSRIAITAGSPGIANIERI